jgi:BolA protein
MALRDRLIQTFTEHFHPTHLEVVDDSASHAGHAGARSGGGHYIATIISDAFAGKSAIERHRMVYALLATEMKSEIHALALTTRTPAEWSKRGT